MGMQVDAAKYPSLGKGFKVTVAEGGTRALGRGWAPTLIGYSMQGACKFGFYEFFKTTYAGIIGEEASYTNQTLLYLAASASAEFFADIALCPMEAVKVRIQTSDYGSTLRDVFPRMKAEEGAGTFFKGVWKGLGARIIMIGTLTALQWFIYDGVKVALRLPRPAPPQMPESLRQKLENESKKIKDLNVLLINFNSIHEK